VITIHSSSEFSEDEIEILQKLSSNIAFALSAYEIENSRRIAFEQLAANLMQFDRSADRLRNPLTVIMNSLELKDELGSDEVLRIVEEQAKRIKKELDEMRKEEIKTFKLTEKSIQRL
jgi:signal transduction histidine kinase